MILARPVSPTMTEVWDGRADPEVRGPAGTEVDVAVALDDRSHKTLALWRGVTTLPVDAPRWANLFSAKIRSAIENSYDDAECCVITFSHPALGAVMLRCERGFTPLRWAAGKDRRGSFVRLINNSEQTPRLSLFAFAQPDRRLTPVLEQGTYVRAESGGLVVASAGAASAQVILSPEVPRDFRRFQELVVVPRLSNPTRSVDGAAGLIELANAWDTASLTANVVGENLRNKVLVAITVALAELIGGGIWAKVERRVASSAMAVSISELESAVGKDRDQTALAKELRERIEGLAASQPYERVRPFAQVLGRHAHQAGLRGEDESTAEFLLRVASRPATVASRPEQELRAQLKAILDSPVLLRAARFLVLGIERIAPSTSGGWTWK